MLLLVPLLGVLGLALVSPVAGIDVQEVELENGLRLLLVPWPERPTVAAGWAVRAGSAQDPPGQSGRAHMLEHLLFRGTRTIGTRNWDVEESLMWERDLTRKQIRELEAKDRRKKELEGLKRRDDELSRRLAQVRVGGEQARIYTEAGALGMGAVTEKDFILSFITVPANKLELWFWLESNRLLEPVFRDTDEEVGIVVQEIRQRVEADPQGLVLEELETLFWGDDKYGRPTGGRSKELLQIHRADVEAQFRRYFSPENLTAVLVGSFDPDRVRQLAREYFGRLASRPEPSQEEEQKPGAETGPLGPKEMERECLCSPQVRMLYRTIPFTHPDAAVLDAVAGLLNGPTGRLHRSLVLDRRLASSAWAEHKALREAGTMTIVATALHGEHLQELEAAWLKEVQLLRSGRIPDAELRKLKNQVVADGYRRMEKPSSLMMRLLIYDSLGDWRYILSWAERVERLTTTEIQQAVNTYLSPERGMTARLRRGAVPGGGGE